MKIKAMMPSLREKKRYLAFEVISKSSISTKEVKEALSRGFQTYLGVRGLAKAGIRLMEESYIPHSQKGLLRVNHKSVDATRASLALINEVGGKDAIVRSIGASGILKKAKTNYLT